MRPCLPKPRRIFRKIRSTFSIDVEQIGTNKNHQTNEDMKIHLISGFLGSGKTTAIQAACDELQRQGQRVAVVMNDQGARLVDADFFNSLGVAGRQVINGCFCCNYQQLDSSVQSLIDTEKPDVIFAESVGSCTDIVATVLKPLLNYRPGTPVTLSLFTDLRLLEMLLGDNSSAFDESVKYIYFKQLEEAGIIIINKTDLANEKQLQRLKKIMEEKYGDKIILYQNSYDPASVRNWLDTLEKNTNGSGLSSLSIDYDVYGAGEAMLAWLDEELQIKSASSATASSQNLIRSIHKKITDRQLPIGHLKFLVNNKDKVSFVQGSLAEYPQIAQLPSGGDKGMATLLINARVQTDPDTLSNLVKEAIAETASQDGAEILVSSSVAFQPGYPTPTHRFLN